MMTPRRRQSHVRLLVTAPFLFLAAFPATFPAAFVAASASLVPALAAEAHAAPAPATTGAGAAKNKVKTPRGKSVGKKTPPAPGKAAPATKAESSAESSTAAPTAAAAASLPPADSSPLAELKKSNASLKKTLQKQAPSWSPERDVRNSEARKIIENFLDFNELSRRALARHWDGLTPQKRTQFVQLLHDLIERSYIKQVHGQADYDLKFEREEKTGTEATIYATLTTTSKGKKIAVALEYKALWKDGHWLVYDVVTDEQSLLENYRAEFNKIINREGFDALLAKMKKKLDEKSQ